MRDSFPFHDYYLWSQESVFHFMPVIYGRKSQFSIDRPWFIFVFHFMTMFHSHKSQTIILVHKSNFSSSFQWSMVNLHFMTMLYGNVSQFFISWPIHVRDHLWSICISLTRIFGNKSQFFISWRGSMIMRVSFLFHDHDRCSRPQTIILNSCLRLAEVKAKLSFSWKKKGKQTIDVYR